jgi:hypothetical protein
VVGKNWGSDDNFFGKLRSVMNILVVLSEGGFREGCMFQNAVSVKLT